MTAPAFPPEAAWADVLAGVRHVQNRSRTRLFARRILTLDQQAELDRLIKVDRLKGFDGEAAVLLLKAVFDGSADDAFVAAVNARLAGLADDASPEDVR